MSDTSGPAFPVILRRDNGGDQFVGPTETWATGLSRRELFAAMAMQGMVANERLATQFAEWRWSVELLAADAVEAADALLAELAKGGKA